MREQLGLARCWYIGSGSSPQEQVMSQNEAEREFDFYCQQAKLLGIGVSPIKRSMRISENEDGRPYMATYYQRVKVEGEEDVIQILKDVVAKKRPPVFAEMLRDRLTLQEG